MLTAWNFYLKKKVNPIIETSNYASTFTVKMTFCHTEGTTHIKMYKAFYRHNPQSYHDEWKC